MVEGEQRRLEDGVDVDSPAEGGSTWAEQLARARRDAFVGRAREIAGLADALRQAAGGPRVVSITGPGGIGKTTLCRRFVDDAAAAGHGTFWLSGDELPANAQLLEAALVGQGATQAWKSLGTRSKADLLVLDAFERLQPLVLHLIRSALPASGPRLLVLISSREKLPDIVTAEVGAVLTDMTLGAFAPSDTARALERAQIPRTAHAAVHAFTKGHPLAIALTVEHLVERGTGELDPSITGDVIAGLVRTFEREIPDEACRAGLHALCLVPLDDGLLSCAVGPAARTVHRWLGARAFVSRTPRGLTVHELVRDVLHTDLVASAEAFHVLAMKLQNALLSRFLDAPFEARYRLVFDMFTLRRETDAVKSVGLDGLLRRTARFASNTDVEHLANHVERHLDAEEAHRFRHWCGRYREGLVLSLDEEGRAAGLQFMIPMSLVTEEDRTSDPFIDHAYGVWQRLIEQDGPGDLSCIRWLFACEGYQSFGFELTASIFLGPMLDLEVARRAGRPLRRWILALMTAPEVWGPPLSVVFRFDRRTDLDMRFRGHVHGAYVRDLTPETETGDPREYARRLMVRFLSDFGIRAEPGEPQIADGVSAEAVKEALNTMHDARALRQSALVRSFAVRSFAAREQVSVLQGARTYLERGIERLAQPAATRSAAKILRATFVEGAPKREVVAADLGLPFGTYRYQLRRAIELLAAELSAS